jgi:hypothetical protein
MFSWEKFKRRKSMRVITASIYVGLLVLCASAAKGESDTSPQSPQSTDANNPPKAEEKQEDIVDRLFSPLDNAVSDINRDLNKGDESAAPAPSE